MANDASESNNLIGSLIPSTTLLLLIFVAGVDAIFSSHGLRPLKNIDEPVEDVDVAGSINCKNGFRLVVLKSFMAVAAAANEADDIDGA